MTCDRHCFTDFREAAVLDVETTGLDPQEDRVISVSVLVFDFETAAREQRIDGQTFDALVNPSVPIPADATKVHGIKDRDVAEAEPFSAVAAQLRDFIGSRPLIGHNVQFDKRFLNAELKRAGERMLTKNRGYCTQQRLREHMSALYGIQKRYWSLDDLVAQLNIDGRAGKQHNAAEDVLLTAKAASLFYSLDNGFLDGDGAEGGVASAASGDEPRRPQSRGAEKPASARPPRPPKDRRTKTGRSGMKVVVGIVVIVVVLLALSSV
jgi:DNA polymerase-3 subunit epsilon